VSTFKAIDDCSHFFIVDVIVSFRWEEGTGVESDRVFSILEFLADNCPKGEVRCVSIHKELFCSIGGPEYRI
jgi:hypothetical protein